MHREDEMSVVQPSAPVVDARCGAAGTRIDLDDVCRYYRIGETTVTSDEGSEGPNRAECGASLPGASYGKLRRYLRAADPAYAGRTSVNHPAISAVSPRRLSLAASLACVGARCGFHRTGSLSRSQAVSGRSGRVNGRAQVPSTRRW